jgi:hypothetical protein
MGRLVSVAEEEGLVVVRLAGGPGGLAGGGGDDGEELEGGDGGSGDEDAVGVGAGIAQSEERWGREEEAGVVDEGVEEGLVEGGEAFELVAGGEGDAEPEAFAARAGEEGSAAEALWVLGVVEVEVADVGDELDLGEGDGQDAAFEVEELKRGSAGGEEVGGGEIARQEGVVQAAEDDFFASWRHGFLCRDSGALKKVQNR